MSVPGKQRTAVGPLLAALAATLILVGCTQDGASPRDAGFRVGLVVPGPISDGGWNASAFEGLQQIRATLGAEVSHVQAGTPVAFEAAFRDYATRGFDLVIGHGFEFQDPAMRIAPAFPRTNFLIVSGGVHRENVGSLKFHLSEATYLAGMLAAGVSRTGKAGTVGGLALPVIAETFDGFRVGARAEKADFAVATTYIGSFEDVAAARAAGDALIAQGADVLFHNADAAGLGVFESARTAGVLAIGSNRDQNSVAPDTVIASAVASIPEAFVSIARAVQDGHFVDRVIVEDLASGKVRLVFNPRLESRIPPELKKDLARAEEAIRTGKLRVTP